MDDIAQHNAECWEALAAAGVAYSRPLLDLDEETARRFLDPYGVMGEPGGKEVLCLASGGGQQSAAFGLLGARVTVLDFSRTQLARDREAGVHYGLDLRLLQGDMRDLSGFPADSFDIVYHAHSLNFIPDPGTVFDEVRRVLRPGGLYRLSYSNPFVHAMFDCPWHGTGYGVLQPYVDGEEIRYPDPHWEVDDEEGRSSRVVGPREWRHGLGGVVNGLLGRGFSLLGMWEDQDGHDPGAEPGSWLHFNTYFPPWLVLWLSRP
jgi:SAM-dependent methyltransferase